MVPPITASLPADPESDVSRVPKPKHAVTAIDVNQANTRIRLDHTRCGPSGPNTPATRVSAAEQNRGPVPEQSLVGRDGHGGSFHLVPGGGAPELPNALADLGDGLGGDGLAEAREATRGVDRHPAAERGDAVAQQLLRLTLPAQADVLVPVELQRGGEVVDLGQTDVLGADAGLG